MGEFGICMEWSGVLGVVVVGLLCEWDCEVDTV